MGVHPETFRRAILAGSETRGAARAVLLALTVALDYKTLTARPGRRTLADWTGLTVNTVTIQLARLRASGDIDALSYPQGGRSRATVYTFPRAWAEIRRRRETYPWDGQELADKTYPWDGEVSETENAKPTRPTAKTYPWDGYPSYSHEVKRSGAGKTYPSHGEVSYGQKDKRSGAGRTAPGIKRPEDALWAGIRARIECSEYEHVTWLDDLKFDRIAGGIVALTAPSLFHAQYVEKSWGAEILAGFQRLHPELMKLQIEEERA